MVFRDSADRHFAARCKARVGLSVCLSVRLCLRLRLCAASPSPLASASASASSSPSASSPSPSPSPPSPSRRPARLGSPARRAWRRPPPLPPCCLLPVPVPLRRSCGRPSLSPCALSFRPSSSRLRLASFRPRPPARFTLRVARPLHASLACRPPLGRVPTWSGRVRVCEQFTSNRRLSRPWYRFADRGKSVCLCVCVSVCFSLAPACFFFLCFPPSVSPPLPGRPAAPSPLGAPASASRTFCSGGACSEDRWIHHDKRASFGAPEFALDVTFFRPLQAQCLLAFPLRRGAASHCVHCSARRPPSGSALAASHVKALWQLMRIAFRDSADTSPCDVERASV